MATIKSVLITGCSSGIGHALAREFKSQGLRVFATARKTDSIADLAALGIETLPLEATSSESIEALKAEVSSRTGGKLDFLVNNAGRNYTVPALEVEMHEIEATFAVNVFAVMRMTQAFAPLLIEAQGTVAMIGSLAGEMPYVFGSVYCASKAALHGYTDTLRLELKPFKVRVVNVVTGGVKSQIARTVRTLRSDSIYLPVEKDYERRLTHSQSLGMDTDKYAKSVVSQLTGWRQKQTIWEGWFYQSFRSCKVALLMFYCRLQVLARLVGHRLHAQVCHCTYRKYARLLLDPKTDLPFSRKPQ
jgi:1-acylglycerone phosphate reductase